MPPPPIDPWFFWTELLFTVVAVILCWRVYFKTKEMYDLTRHEGIRHFRIAFFLFGLSYLLRFFLSLFFLTSMTFSFFIPREWILLLFILPLSYVSTIGIISLISCSVWKQFSRTTLILVGNGIAVALLLISVFLRSPRAMFMVQLALLLLAVALLFIIRQHPKISKMRALYLLVATLWLVNLLTLGPRRGLPFEVQAVFQALSIGVFIYIHHRLVRRVR